MSFFNEFKAVAESIPYINKGVFYSELFLFLRECRKKKVTLIVESGVKYGFSTQVLAAAYEGELISIDQAEAQVPEGVTFIQGDSIQEIPKLLADFPEDGAVGILLDGPKGEKALALKDECLNHPAVKVVAVHDVKPGNGETLHSHDAAFRRNHGKKLDALILTDYAAKYPDGPGLGIWIK
jgi:hypothetical protein